MRKALVHLECELISIKQLCLWFNINRLGYASKSLTAETRCGNSQREQSEFHAENLLLPKQYLYFDKTVRKYTVETMRHKNRIASVLLLLTFALGGVSCQNKTEAVNAPAAAAIKAQTPTEAYKMLFAAVKAKNTEQIRQLMSKGSLGLAGMSAGQQKKSLDKILENGLVAPTLAPALTEIREERIKDTFGRIEVKNEKENRWEDLPFVLEDGGWKLAVGDLFAGTFDPSNSIPKGRAQTEMEASNTMPMVPTNSTTTNLPNVSNSNKASKMPPPDGVKTVEVPKENPPKK